MPLYAFRNTQDPALLVGYKTNQSGMGRLRRINHQNPAFTATLRDLHILYKHSELSDSLLNYDSSSLSNSNEDLRPCIHLCPRFGRNTPLR
jgi:hypothetical protein